MSIVHGKAPPGFPFLVVDSFSLPFLSSSSSMLMRCRRSRRERTTLHSPPHPTSPFLEGQWSPLGDDGGRGGGGGGRPSHPVPPFLAVAEPALSSSSFFFPLFSFFFFFPFFFPRDKAKGVKRVGVPNRSTKSAERKREQKEALVPTARTGVTFSLSSLLPFFSFFFWRDLRTISSNRRRAIDNRLRTAESAVTITSVGHLHSPPRSTWRAFHCTIRTALSGTAFCVPPPSPLPSPPSQVGSRFREAARGRQIVHRRAFLFSFSFPPSAPSLRICVAAVATQNCSDRSCPKVLEASPFPPSLFFISRDRGSSSGADAR